MKRSTAMSRLRDVADGLDRAAIWPEATVSAAFVFGEMLETESDLDRIDLAFVVAEPAAAVPWLARPAHLEALAALLRFTKLPLSWRWRPTEWPVRNHEIERALRVWSADGGRDQAAFEALAARRLDDVVLDAPPDADAHRGDGVHAEDHLWWASAGFLELDDAIQRLRR